MLEVKIMMGTSLYVLLACLCLAQTTKNFCPHIETTAFLKDAQGKIKTLPDKELKTRFIWGERPAYPLSCRCQGTVLMLLSIGSDGQVECFQFLSGHPLFKAAIEKVIKRWVFTPYHTDEGVKSFQAIMAYTVATPDDEDIFTRFQIQPCGSSRAAVPNTVQWVNPAEMESRAIEKVAPLRDAHARASGKVLINVKVNPDGAVSCAIAVNGHPLLRAAAIAAATKWKFKPRLVHNQAVPYFGHILFSFSQQ